MAIKEKVTEFMNFIGLYTDEQTYDLELKRNNWMASMFCITKVLLIEGDENNNVERHVLMHVKFAFEIAMKNGDMTDKYWINLMNEVLEKYGLEKLE